MHTKSFQMPPTNFNYCLRNRSPGTCDSSIKHPAEVYQWSILSLSNKLQCSLMNYNAYLPVKLSHVLAQRVNEDLGMRRRTLSLPQLWVMYAFTAGWTGSGHPATWTRMGNTRQLICFYVFNTITNLYDFYELQKKSLVLFAGFSRFIDWFSLMPFASFCTSVTFWQRCNSVEA